MSPIVPAWWKREQSIFQTKLVKMAAAPDPEVNRPPELSKARVDSWSHLNSDKPIMHSHALKISRFRQCLDQFETSMFIQDSFSVNVAGVKTNWELRYLKVNILKSKKSSICFAGCIQMVMMMKTPTTWGSL